MDARLIIATLTPWISTTAMMHDGRKSHRPPTRLTGILREKCGALNFLGREWTERFDASVIGTLTTAPEPRRVQIDDLCGHRVVVQF